MASQLMNSDQALDSLTFMMTVHSLVSNWMNVNASNFSWPPLVQKHSYIDSESDDSFDFSSPTLVYRIVDNDFVRISVIIVAILSAAGTYMFFWSWYELTKYWFKLINI